MSSAYVDKLTAMKDECLQQLEQVETADEIEAVKVRFLGRKGALPAAMKELGALAPDARPAAGRAANKVKQAMQQALEDRLNALSQAASTGDEIDMTLPGRRRGVGHKHPISKVADDCARIFRRLGFVVVEGPDIEDEYHNFDALNTPADHPSRDLQDTFYLDDGRLLRTQTSPVQIRVMEQQDPPVRIVCPGRCYRRDTIDATHTINFSQIEGLYVDRAVSMADLKGTLLTFAREMFGDAVQIRLRPHFFPFTEPSVECDVLFEAFKDGEDAWLEIAGAGMVDPNVLRKVGYDPEKWTGFAFGMGLERIAMLKYGILDMRLLFENNVEFLQQA